MALYVLVTEKSLKDTPADIRLKSAFGKDIKEIAHNAWVLDAQQTTEEISQTIFPRDAQGDAEMTHVVFLVAGNWWGYHYKPLWEWLALRAAKKPNGE